MFLLSLESRPAGETPGVQRPKCEDDQSPATTVEIWSALLHHALSCRYPECIRDKVACTHGTCSEKERTLWYNEILICLSIFIPPADKLFYQNVPHGATDSLHAQITPQTSYPKVSELRLPVSQITHIKHTYTHTHTHGHQQQQFLGGRTLAEGVRAQAAQEGCCIQLFSEITKQTYVLGWWNWGGPNRWGNWHVWE